MGLTRPQDRELYRRWKSAIEGLHDSDVAARMKPFTERGVNKLRNAEPSRFENRTRAMLRDFLGEPGPIAESPGRSQPGVSVDDGILYACERMSETIAQLLREARTQPSRTPVANKAARPVTDREVDAAERERQAGRTRGGSSGNRPAPLAADARGHKGR